MLRSAGPMTPRPGLMVTLTACGEAASSRNSIGVQIATWRFGVAMARLKRAVIPMLIGNKTEPMRSIFEQVFR
jgi:hypothetical protein